MAAAQLMLPANRAFDSNGFPEAGATVKLYQSGTTTPANFYADAALTIALGSTLTANAAGRLVTVAYQDTSTPFRLKVFDANGDELDDIDPFYFGLVPGVDGTPASVQIGTVSTGAAGASAAVSNSGTAQNAVLDFTIPMGAQGPAGDVAKVTNRAGLSDIAGTTAGMARLLTESGREGTFVFSTADLSAEVTADTAQGVYVAPSSDTTGASGAWVRKFDGAVQVNWFGAEGDGATDDTTAVLKALTYAFNNGLAVDGGDSLYAISGSLQFSAKVRPYIRRLRLKQLALTTATQTLYLLNCDNIRIDSLFIDTGTDATVGERDTTTPGLSVEGGSGHRVKDVEVTGSGMGALIRIRGTTDSVYEDLYVHDGLFSKTELDPTGINVIDDVLQGIRIDDNIRCKFVRPHVARLHGNATYFTRSGAVYTPTGQDYANSEIKLFPNLRTRGLSAGGNEDVMVTDPQIYDTEQAIDFSGSGSGYGNVRTIISGGETLDCGSVGVKWGGAQTDCKVVNHTVRNTGMYGYIASGSWRGYKTSGVEIIGCTVEGVGYNDIQNDIGDVGSATYIQEGYFGFLALDGYTADATDDVRFIGCRADAKTFLRLYGDDPNADPARPWPVAGSTTAYLAQPWTGPTGDYSVTFDTTVYLNGDGAPNSAPTIRSETKTVTLTSGSDVVTWTGGLTNPVGMPIVARPAIMSYGYASVLFNDDAATGLTAGAGIPFNQETKKPIALIDCESFGHTIAREIGGFHRDVCHVTTTSSQTLTTGVATNVTFDSEIEDTMDMHSTSSDIELVRPQRPGWYRIHGYVRFAPTSSGIRLLEIVKVSAVQFEIPATPVAGQACVIQFDEEVQFTAADIAANAYVFVRATQTSGADLSLTTPSYLKVERVRAL